MLIKPGRENRDANIEGRRRWPHHSPPIYFKCATCHFFLMPPTDTVPIWPSLKSHPSLPPPSYLTLFPPHSHTTLSLTPPYIHITFPSLSLYIHTIKLINYIYFILLYFFYFPKAAKPSSIVPIRFCFFGN